MNLRKILLPALFLTLAPYANSGAQNPSPAATQPSSAAACPSAQFDVFLPKFIDDIRIQKTFSADPLQESYVDANAEPEPRAVTKKTPRSKLKFPLIPNAEEQRKQGLEIKTTQTGSRRTSVFMHKPDTGYQITYFFRKAGGCWQLYRTKDDSL